MLSSLSLPKFRHLFLLGTLCASAAVDAAGGFEFQDAGPTRTLRPGEVSAPATIQSQTNRWQNSGVWVEAGGSYLVTAQGQWQLAPTCPPTGPDGVGLYNIVCWDIGGKTVNSGTHAALIGRIGRDGPPFLVGANLEFTAQQSGALYFMVNDHPEWFADNSGSVSAKVRMFGAAQNATAPARDTTEIIIRQETPQTTNTVKIRRGGGGGGSGGTGSQ